MEPLADPLDDRVCKDSEAPPALPLSHELLFPTAGSKVPDWRLVNKHVAKEGRLHKEDFVTIIKETTEILKNEPNLLEMDEPVVIVGDIHGQYYDLQHLIEKAGDPETTNYLFMGDYVDRGIFSVEWIILLFCLKLNYPESFVLLRGNHECRNMTDHFTFREETIKKFDQEVYDLIMDAFDALPLSWLAGKKYFAMHGGISPELKKIEQINKFDRFKEPPLDGLMWDLLWADPADDDSATKTEYIDNEEREWSFVFGKKPCKKLLDKNNLMTIVRAHQVQIDGYKMHRWDGASSFPYVITIFSAPNYCDYYSNKASVLILESGNVSIKQYDQSDHPYHLPDQVDIFTWSMPFLAEKVISMLSYIVNKLGEEDSVTEEDGKAAIEELSKDMKIGRANKLKSKVKVFARMQKMFTTLKDESELILKLKGMAPDGKIPRGVLLEGRPAIKDALKEFNRAKEVDKVNERRPKGK